MSSMLRSAAGLVLLGGGVGAILMGVGAATRQRSVRGLLARPSDDARDVLSSLDAARKGVDAWSGRRGILAVGYTPDAVWVRAEEGYDSIPARWYGYPVRVYGPVVPAVGDMRTLWAVFPPLPSAPARWVLTVYGHDPVLRQRAIQGLAIVPGVRPVSRRETRPGEMVVEVEAPDDGQAVERVVTAMTHLLPVTVQVLDRRTDRVRAYEGGVRVPVVS